MLVAVLATIGLLLVILGIRKLYKKQLISAGGSAFAGMAILAGCAFLASVSMNLYTYHRLTQEQSIASVEITQLGLQQYRLLLTEHNDIVTEWQVNGDEWQLDARVIKWTGMANLLGLDTVYRLERISGRYQDIERERHDVRSVYSLSAEQGTDVWKLVQENRNLLPWVDTVYGSAGFVPMADGAVYEVSVTVSGLVIRPGNEIAAEAVKNWP